MYRTGRSGLVEERRTNKRKRTISGWAARGRGTRVEKRGLRPPRERNEKEGAGARAAKKTRTTGVGGRGAVVNCAPKTRCESSRGLIEKGATRARVYLHVCIHSVSSPFSPRKHHRYRSITYAWWTPRARVMEARRPLLSRMSSRGPRPRVVIAAITQVRMQGRNAAEMRPACTTRFAFTNDSFRYVHNCTLP